MSDEHLNFILKQLQVVNERMAMINRQSLINGNFNIYIKEVKRTLKSVDDLLFMCEDVKKRQVGGLFNDD